MDFTVPQTIIIDAALVFWIVGVLISGTAAAVWGGARVLSSMTAGFKNLNSKIETLQSEVDTMNLRNEKRDLKTEKLEQAHSDQERTIAVMANDTAHVREAVVRMESAVMELSRYLREDRK